MKKININKSQYSLIEGKTKNKKYTVYINGKKDKTFSECGWKRTPKVGKGFYCGGAVFKIKKVTDDSIYAVEESRVAKKVIVSESQLKPKMLMEGAAYDEFCSNQPLRYRIICRMVEDGYLFHGTDGEWDEFDVSKIKGGLRGVYGYGAYFTDAAYKCEEYGEKFLILDSNGFKFLDINEKINKDYNIFSEIYSEYARAKNEIENVRNIREYDYYSEIIDDFERKFDMLFFNDILMIIDKSDDGLTYRSLNSKLGGHEDISQKISNFYLHMGYDGFICDNQYVIFNFEKLKQNIVKDKEALIARYMNVTETKKMARKPYLPYANESVKKYLSLLKEEVVADGNAEHNPYKKRWEAERKALKDFICNFGKVMTSRENGKTYKVYYDKVLSQLIGFNYCICLQWDAVEMKPKSVLFVRALDKFTDRMFQANFDYRGRDNQIGTSDDFNYKTN